MVEMEKMTLDEVIRKHYDNCFRGSRNPLADINIKDLAQAIRQHYKKELIEARIEELEKMRLPMLHNERPIVEYKDADGFVQCDKNWEKRINERIAELKNEPKRT